MIVRSNPSSKLVFGFHPRVVILEISSCFLGVPSIEECIKNEEFAKKYKDKKWEKSLLENDFFDNLDAVIVLTEWDIYSKINWIKVSKKMRSPAWVFDTRLIVDGERVTNSGLSFWRVGIGDVKRGYIF